MISTVYDSALFLDAPLQLPEGHLFQNRYKSILCQEDTYLLELVRYIHLNPIRAGLVQSLEELDSYAYSGHSCLVGKVENSWQETEGVLALFGKRKSSSQRSYRAFVDKGIDLGRRPELAEGGLIRSVGGWKGIEALRREKSYQRSDERILGDGDFVTEVLAQAEEELERRHALRASGMDLNQIARRVSEVMGMEQKELWAKGRYAWIVDARSLFCFWAVRELGVSMSSLGREFGISVPAISKSVKRGQQIAESRGLTLDS